MAIKSEWQQHVDAARKKYGLPPGVIEAVLEQENGGGRDTSTSIGYGKRSYGIGQFQLGTAKEYGYQGSGADLSKPEIGIDLVGRKLKEDYGRYGDWNKVAAGWYGGSRGASVYGSDAGNTRHLMSKDSGQVSNAPSINEYVSSWRNHAANYGLPNPDGAPPPSPPAMAGGGMIPGANMLKGMFGGDLIPQNIKDMFPTYPGGEEEENPAIASMRTELENLKQQFSQSWGQLQSVMKSDPQDYAGQADKAQNPALAGLGYGLANIASALSGNDRYAQDEMQAKTGYDEARQAQMMQARGQALQMSVERWSHVRDRLEQQGDKYNALLANEKLTAAQEKVEKWKVEYAGAITLANTAVSQGMQAQADLQRALIAKGVIFGVDEDGEPTVTMAATGADKDGKLQPVKDAEDTTIKALELLKDPKFANGKNAGMAKGVVMRSYATWREGDIVTSPYNRLMANQTAIGKMYDIKNPEALKAMITASAEEQIREAALLELATGKTVVPGALAQARALGLVSPAAPVDPNLPGGGGENDSTQVKPRTAAQQGAAKAQEVIDAKRKAAGKKTDKEFFVDKWPPAKPDMSGGPEDDLKELVRYYKEIVEGHDQANLYGLKVPEDIAEDAARAKLTSYKQELKAYQRKLDEEAAKDRVTASKLAEKGRPGVKY